MTLDIEDMLTIEKALASCIGRYFDAMVHSPTPPTESMEKRLEALSELYTRISIEAAKMQGHVFASAETLEEAVK